MSNQIFKFVLADGSPVTKSFNVQPTSYPTPFGDKILTGDPLTVSGSPIVLSVYDQLYKVELNQESANDWFFLATASNSTASANIVSGSYYSTSLCLTYFDFNNFQINPLTIKRVEITPANSGIAWQDSFVLGDTLRYLPDSDGNLTIPLVPEPLDVVVVGEKKKTPFSIFPSGSSCTASQVIVTDSGVINIVTPLNQAFFGYTAKVSDNRYVAKGGSIDNAISASYSLNASTASFALNAG